MARSIAIALLHQGMTRTRNDDNLYMLDRWVRPGQADAFDRSCACDDALQFYAVADGMGGKDVGDAAAQTVLALLDRQRQRCQSGVRFNFIDFARDFVDEANRAVCQLLAPYQGLPVGTTLSVLVIDHNTAYTVSLGNSRVYLWRENTLFCLTHDHIEQLPDRRRLTRYIGQYDEEGLLDTDNLTRMVVEKGDIFLLTSDGITDLINDTVLASCLRTPKAFIQQVQQIQQTALDAGAPDNLSVIGIKILDPGQSDTARSEPRKRRRASAGLQTGKIRPEDTLQQNIREHRWIRPLLFFLMFVLLGLLLGKLLLAMPAWLSGLLGR